MSTSRQLFRAAVHRLPERVRGALQRELDGAVAGQGKGGRQAGHGGQVGGGKPGGGKPGADTATLDSEFFQALIADGDIERAAVTMTRHLISGSSRRRVTPDLGRARAIMTGLQQYKDLRPVADICLALCSIPDLVPEVAWRLFHRNDLALVLRWAPVEYFQVGFSEDAGTAAASLRSALDGAVPLDAGPAAWLEIALAALAVDRVDDADGALGRATAALGSARGGKADPDELRERAVTLRQWIDRARRAAQPVDSPSDELSFAAVGYRHPDRRAVSGDISDPLETLAALGHLARRGGLHFEGADEGGRQLATVANRLVEQVPSARRLDGAARTVRLHQVDRDVSRYAAVPDGTWILVSDWLAHPLGDSAVDLPLHPNLRPIFAAFAISPRRLAAPGVVDYLRRHGPIGCRDRATMYLLHAAGVDAFFSGPLTATLDAVVSPREPGPSSETLYLDVDPDDGSQRRKRVTPARRVRSLAENVDEAVTTMRRYRDNARRIVTSDVRLWAAARAVGCETELRPDDPIDGAVTDYVGMPAAEFDALRARLSDKLAVVLGAVLEGADEDAVRAAWRDACAAEVAAPRQEIDNADFAPTLSFDLPDACRQIRAASVTVERSVSEGLEGSELNVELSADENYKRQTEVTLDSIVERTRRPVRAFVLCRGWERSDYDEMVRKFPNVSFVFLPTDAVQYGTIAGKNAWVTIVTMDRTMLPELLPDVDRIIHFDLDAMCLTDLAEMFDVDLEGSPIAAVSASPRYISGFATVQRSAKLLRRIGEPQAAHEFTLLMHKQHAFDFDVFNAGIMVMDLDVMRADDFCGRYLPYVQRYGINGQIVLAMYTGARRKQLDRDWNRLMRLELPDDPKIAHWAGPWKPWRRSPFVYRRHLWRDQEARMLARVGGEPERTA